MLIRRKVIVVLSAYNAEIALNYSLAHFSRPTM